jgi:hypothetical protein
MFISAISDFGKTLYSFLSPNPRKVRKTVTESPRSANKHQEQNQEDFKVPSKIHNPITVSDKSETFERDTTLIIPRGEGGLRKTYHDLKKKYEIDNQKKDDHVASNKDGRAQIKVPDPPPTQPYFSPVSQRSHSQLPILQTQPHLNSSRGGNASSMQNSGKVGIAF